MSGSVNAVQQMLGVPTTSCWDATTLGALAPFQQSGMGALPMHPTGEPDPATLINAGYYNPLDYLSRAQVEYLQGGAAPGTFWRDLGVASNQVPQWVWIGLGVGFVGLGYWTYRSRRARARG
jgi:hypothetical protein